MLKVKVINTSPYPLPEYKTMDPAGLDLIANTEQSLTLTSLERALIPTGLFIELPRGTEAQIRPRSGLAWQYGLSVLNSPGTIDADYRGEIKVLLINLSNQEVTIQPGERIAQMVVSVFGRIQWESVSELNETARGQGGYGHTGK